VVGLVLGGLISWHDRKIKINLNLLEENNLELSYGHLWMTRGYFIVFLLSIVLSIISADSLKSVVIISILMVVGYHFSYNWFSYS